MPYRIVTRGVPARELAMIEEWEFPRTAYRRLRHLNREVRRRYRKMGQRAPYGYWMLYTPGGGDGLWREDVRLVRKARDAASIRILGRKFEAMTSASLAGVYQRSPRVPSNR